MGTRVFVMCNRGGWVLCVEVGLNTNVMTSMGNRRCEKGYIYLCIFTYWESRRVLKELKFEPEGEFPNQATSMTYSTITSRVMG